VVEKHSLEAYLVYSPVGLIVVGRVMRLAVMWRAVMWVVMVGWRMMGVVVVLFEVNDAVVEGRSLEPCIYIATSIVDFAVDVLRLILDLVIYIMGFAKDIVEDVLSISDG
jgi:hypothetical protein